MSSMWPPRLWLWAAKYGRANRVFLSALPKPWKLKKPKKPKKPKRQKGPMQQLKS